MGVYCSSKLSFLQVRPFFNSATCAAFKRTTRTLFTCMHTRSLTHACTHSLSLSRHTHTHTHTHTHKLSLPNTHTHSLSPHTRARTHACTRALCPCPTTGAEGCMIAFDTSPKRNERRFTAWQQCSGEKSSHAVYV